MNPYNVAHREIMPTNGVDFMLDWQNQCTPSMPEIPWATMFGNYPKFDALINIAADKQTPTVITPTCTYSMGQLITVLFENVPVGSIIVS